MSGPLPTFLTAPAAWLALPLLLIGLWWIARSWRAATCLAPPRCGRCSHPIEPREAPRCPECGAGETEYAFGRRRVSAGGVSAGFGMVLLALPLAYAADQQLAGRSMFDRWSEPMTGATSDAVLWRWVADDGPQSGIASTRLVGRMRNPLTVGPSADALLADPSWPRAATGTSRREPPGGLLLATALALRRNGLDDQRWEAITTRLVPQPSVRVRTRHRLGSPIAIGIDAAPEAFRAVSFWVSARQIRVDEEVVPRVEGKPAQFSFGGEFLIESPRSVGRHRVELSWRQALVRNDGDSSRAITMRARAPSTGDLDWWRDGTWIADVEVVPADAALFVLVRAADRHPFKNPRDAIASLQVVDLGSRGALFLELRPWSDGARPFGTWTVSQGGVFRVGVGPIASPAAPRERARGGWTVTGQPFDPNTAIVLRYEPVAAPEQDPAIPDDEIWGESFEITIPAREMVRDRRRVAPTWNWTRK
jgi:hypothetical protein